MIGYYKQFIKILITWRSFILIFKKLLIKINTYINMFIQNNEFI